MTTRRILVTGATGYVGGRLVPHLLDRGDEVVCLVRSSLDRPFASAVEIAQGSADDADAIEAAAEGCDVAYFLIHSLDSTDFEERDRQMADAFRRGCEAAGVRRIVYLGGLGEGDDLSPHLRSRQEVGRVLASGSVAVTELRAAVVIGSGSASFEMLRDGQSKVMENMAKANPMAKMPGFDAMQAQQAAFFKAMTGGLGKGMMGSSGPARESGGDDLDEIKQQLADLQAKLNRMGK